MIWRLLRAILLTTFTRRQNTHSFHNNGFIHPKIVDVSPNPSGKGVVLTTRKQKATAGQVRKASYVQNLKAGSSRKTNAAVRNSVKSYRPEQVTVRLHPIMRPWEHWKPDLR